jgi:hypothetical protein
MKQENNRGLNLQVKIQPDGIFTALVVIVAVC